MKKVLILSYYWPPGSGPGVQRWLKFCKFLPGFGWQPTVVTVKNGSYPSTDPSLENDIPNDLKVVKTKTMEPFTVYNALRGKKGKSVEVAMASVKGKQSTFAKFANYVRSNYFIPDARVGWNTFAYKAAKKEIEQNCPDIIITTGPPHSTHLVGLRLKEEFGIKWVVDFRDPWTTIYYNQFLLRTKSSSEKDLSYENEVLKKADLVLTASPGITEDLISRNKNTYTIPNGFDEDDFIKVSAKLSNKFRMSYVGNLKPVQNTVSVWKALRELCNENEKFKHAFEFEITGNIADEVLDGLKENDILDHVLIKKFVPHKDAISRMLSSHVLFLPIPIDEGNKRILTGKIFEYLATQRPILSVGPKDGNAAEILANCDQLPMCDYDDISQIKSQILDLFLLFQKDQFPEHFGNKHFKDYSRKGTTQTLSKTLELA